MHNSLEEEGVKTKIATVKSFPVSKPLPLRFLFKWNLSFDNAKKKKKMYSQNRISV